MNFNIGQMFVQATTNEDLIIVLPIGDHVIATRIELYRLNGKNSVRTEIELYHREDATVTNNVQRWLRGE